MASTGPTDDLERQAAVTAYRQTLLKHKELDAKLKTSALPCITAGVCPLRLAALTTRPFATAPFACCAQNERA